MTGSKNLLSEPEDSQEMDVAQVIESLPEEKREVVIGLLASHSYRGPVMPPEMLAHVEKIIPGGANRVLQLTEKEQAHRHAMEKTENKTFAWQAKVSLIGGLGAFFGLVVGIIFCAANGYTWGVSSLAAIGAFGVISHIIKIPSRAPKDPSH